MKKRKFHLTENGKAVLVTAPVALFATEVLARGGTLGFAIAGVATFVAARHGGDIKNVGQRLLRGLVGDQTQDPEQDLLTDKEIRVHMREYGLDNESRRSKREEYEEEDEDWGDTNERPSRENGRDDDFNIPHFRGGTFVFSDLLATGWLPSMDEIFLARLPDGTDVFVKVNDLVQIALSGATRNGKTSLIRQLLSELIYVGCDCILLDPHYTPYDVETNEDWTPFTARLKLDPMECKSYERIAQVVRHAGTVILPKRRKLRSESKPVGKPIFIVIDEYPSVVANCGAEVQRHIANLLREGGKYKIHLCIASHDFQVKTAFPDIGGSLRDQFKTVFHAGGDIYTVNALLDMDKVDRKEEASLGKGRVYLRAEAHKQASLAHTPWMDNEAIFTLVGPSTYVQQEVVEDEYEDDFGVEPSNGADKKQPISPIAQPQIKKATLADAIEVWNESPGVGRPQLREALQARGLDCSDYLSDQLLKAIKQQ